MMKMRTLTSMFDPLNPKVGPLVEIAKALAQENRFNGHGAFPVSVAQHSVLVSHIAEHAARQHGASSRLVNYTAKLGLLHDAAEAYIKDIPKPLKKFLGAVYTDLEDAVFAAVVKRHLRGLPLSQRALDYVARADKESYLQEAKALFAAHSDSHVTEISWRAAMDLFLKRAQELGLDIDA